MKKLVIEKSVLVLVLNLFLFELSLAAEPRKLNTEMPSGVVVAQPVMEVKNENSNPGLEREKFEFQKNLEEDKLKVERQKVWASALSVCIPLFIGVITLIVQGRQRRKDSLEAFELKAIEIIFSGDSPVATKNRAGALQSLFPKKFQKDFGTDFEPSQFAGPRFEAKLEVFKAACEKAVTPEEVYKIWASVFPNDEWIKPLVNQVSIVSLPQAKDTNMSSSPDQNRHDVSKAKLEGSARNNEGYSNNF